MYRPFKYLLGVLALVLGIVNLAFSQGGDAELGQKLFKANCGQCHNKDMKSDLTGPALGPALEDWADYPAEDLHAWIRNSQELINSGHPLAVSLWNNWKPTVMPPNPNLTESDIASLIAYIEGVYKGTFGAPVASAATDAAPQAKGLNQGWIIGGLGVALILLAFVLRGILQKLRQVAAIQRGEDYQMKTLGDMFKGRTAIAFYVLLFIIMGGYFTVNRAVSLNRQQGYQPEQPIAFSHVIHAGINKIDCQYCHDGARRSKHSVIPATNTCMNCHAAIKKGSRTGTSEITKIYASIGFNPNTNTYIDDYDNLSQEEVKAVFTKWIGDQYELDNGTMDSKGDRLVKEQWGNIVSSLTNDVKDKVQGPIPWVRIHNLPDHVYFSHEQHVVAGGQACQTCHGPVEEMEVVSQYATLSMGWCINCHRQTSVNFSNDYYDIFTHFHEELSNGERSTITVEDIGGTECQKCHY